MSALASLPARAAARVKALNADAPKLAAAATGPLRKADLLNPRASVLLSMLAVPDLLQADLLENGLTLHEARLVYYNTTAVVATLANVIRRIVWRDIFAEPAVNGDADGAVVEQLGYALQTLCLMRAPACTPLPPCAPLENALHNTLSWRAVQRRLTCPFQVAAGPDRRTAVREAAKR